MIRTIGKAILLTSALFSSQTCLAAPVYWTFPPSAAQGVVTSIDGKTSWFKPNIVPSNPNPSGTVWTRCSGDAITISQKVDGTNVPTNIANHMLSNILFAQANNSTVRVLIDRNSKDECFAIQFLQQK